MKLKNELDRIVGLLNDKNLLNWALETAKHKGSTSPEVASVYIYLKEKIGGMELAKMVYGMECDYKCTYKQVNTLFKKAYKEVR